MWILLDKLVCKRLKKMSGKKDIRKDQIVRRNNDLLNKDRLVNDRRITIRHQIIQTTEAGAEEEEMEGSSWQLLVGS